jgi:hypothetical protein
MGVVASIDFFVKHGQPSHNAWRRSSRVPPQPGACLMFIAFLPSRPLKPEVGLPHVFSKQLPDLSPVEPENTKF